MTPSINRYFYIPDADLDLSASTTILANQFTNDEGVTASEFAGFGQGSYNNLFINGIIQPGNIYNVSPVALFFPPQISTIYAGTPIALEIVQLTARVS